MLHKQQVISICLISFLSFTACNSHKTDNKEEKAATTDASKERKNLVELSKDQYKTLGVTIGSVEMRQLSGSLKVSGVLDAPPQSLVSVTTQMGGIVKSTPLLQGTQVKKGQIIATLQNQEFVQLQQDYLDTHSQLEYQQTEFQRQQQLQKENVNAQKTVQSAKAQYNSLQARVAGLRQRLQLININPDQLTPSSITSTINIYAPVSGSVTKVNVNVGKFINPNDIMFEIVDVSELHVELNVFEKDLPKVREGQTVRFTLGNESDQRLAKITLVGKEIGTDKTVRIHAKADIHSGNFLPGTFLSGFIETAAADVPTLPISAVVDFEGKKYIFIIKEANTPVQHEHKAEESESEKKRLGDEIVFEMLEITTGSADGGFVEIVLPSDMDAGKIKVVLNGAYDLLSKMKNSAEED